MTKFLFTICGALFAFQCLAREFSYEYNGQTLIYTILDEVAKTCQPKAGHFNSRNGIIYPGNAVSGELFIPEIAIDGGIEYSVTSLGSYAFDAHSGLAAVSIPASVITIGEFAFYECSGLTSVIIGNSVTTIGNSAFYGCRDLKSVSIPASVTTIGEFAFYECSGLASVIIGNSVTAIGNSAFYGCCNLKSVSIPASVTTIGEFAFYKCSGLTSVIIGSSVTSIGDMAFNGCSGLKKAAYPSCLANQLEYTFECIGAVAYNPDEVTIEEDFIYDPQKKVIFFAPSSFEGEYIVPASVTTIGKSAFYDCSGLTSVIMGPSVSTIEENAFRECTGLTSVIVGPAVTLISNDAFRNCSGLTSIIIGDSVTTIGDRALFGCNSLTSLTIPNSVTSIGLLAFRYCSGLTSIIIPPSVTTLGKYPFDECTGLIKSAYPNNLSNPFSNGVAITYNPNGAIFEDGFIYGPEKKIIYFAPLSIVGEYIIPTSVNSIEDSAFIESGLTTVRCLSEIPPKMAANSFEGLYATAKLVVPEGAVTDYLATNWSQFENISLAKSGFEIVSYYDGVLKYRLIPSRQSDEENIAVVIPGDYTSLKEVTIPWRFTVESDGNNPVRYIVEGVGYNAFNGCSELVSISFHNRSTTKVIGDYAFARTGIEAINIPGTVESIGDYSFSYCLGLTSVSIPKSVKSIGEGAFYGASRLCGLTLNEGLKTIGAKAFATNSSRNPERFPLYIPSTVTTIGQDAFSDGFRNFPCNRVDISNLSAWCNIDFENTSANPLSQCGKLYVKDEEVRELIIPNGLTEIKPFSFSNAWNLTSITFNDDLQCIGDYAFINTYSVKPLTIPGKVTEIGVHAFSNSASSVTLEYGIESLHMSEESFDALFSLSCNRELKGLNFSLSRLSTLKVGNDVAEIPSNQFKGASNLTSLMLGSGLIAIGAEAFSGCSSLEKVVIPPSVETIGALAFSSDSKLASITMGHSVKAIGEKAFDGCKASIVSITAQTPPTAPNNTFSNYTGELYVYGHTAADAYLDAYTCWDRFSLVDMIGPSGINLGDTPFTINGRPGDTFQLSATLMPENVTLPQIFWSSTNPDIATVDYNGLVTLHVDTNEVMSLDEGDEQSECICKIIAESLYADGPIVEVKVTDTTTGVENVIDDDANLDHIENDAPIEVYTLQGIMVSRDIQKLTSGIYVVRQGKNVTKIVVK